MYHYVKCSTFFTLNLSVIKNIYKKTLVGRRPFTLHNNASFPSGNCFHNFFSFFLNAGLLGNTAELPVAGVLVIHTVPKNYLNLRIKTESVYGWSRCNGICRNAGTDRHMWTNVAHIPLHWIFGLFFGQCIANSSTAYNKPHIFCWKNSNLKTWRIELCLNVNRAADVSIFNKCFAFLGLLVCLFQLYFVFAMFLYRSFGCSYTVL